MQREDRPWSRDEQVEAALEGARGSIEDAKLASTPLDLLSAYDEAARSLAVLEFLGAHAEREEKQLAAIFHAIVARIRR